MVTPMYLLYPKVQMPITLMPKHHMHTRHHTTTQPPLIPNHNLKVQAIEFTTCNDKFPQEGTNRKLEKYDTLKTTLCQHGWLMVPTIVITASIQGSIHTTTTKKLTELQNPNQQNTKLNGKPPPKSPSNTSHISF